MTSSPQPPIPTAPTSPAMQGVQVKPGQSSTDIAAQNNPFQLATAVGIDARQRMMRGGSTLQGSNPANTGLKTLLGQ